METTIMGHIGYRIWGIWGSYQSRDQSEASNLACMPSHFCPTAGGFYELARKVSCFVAQVEGAPVSGPLMLKCVLSLERESLS